jgi:hypothetical protein
VRYEWLSQYYWTDLEEVQLFATQWMYGYNHERPKIGLGRLHPKTVVGHGRVTLVLNALNSEGVTQFLR